jgi:hypothetical protein
LWIIWYDSHYKMIMWWVTPIQNSSCNCIFVSFNLDFKVADRKTTDSEVKDYGDSQIQSTVHFSLNIILIFVNRISKFFNFATFSEDLLDGRILWYFRILTRTFFTF